MAWIDVHTHLNMLDVPIEEALTEAETCGVPRVITIGTCPDDLPTVYALAKRYYPRVGCALGIHPHEAEHWGQAADDFLRTHARRPEVVAIGEIGLDYHYDHAPREIQRAAFRAQLQLANDFGLPVEIHTRDAEDDTALILNEHQGPRRGLLHCFTGTQNLADVALACGYDISISGVVTFKNAGALRDVVVKTPLDRLHVETDAPFLAPIPFRGKKNRPAWVTHTAAVVASLKGVTVEALQVQLNANAAALFPRMNLN